MATFFREASKHVRTNVRTAFLSRYAIGIVSAISLFGQTNVVTQHNDIGRTGQNITETILTPANVNPAQFGKLFTLNVDGQVIAQPLYLSSVSIGGALHHVVFVATEHDSVYAFDASNGTLLWQASLLDASHGSAAGGTPVPVSLYNPPCGDITNHGVAAPEYGITGTPVIDASTGTLYVVSKTLERHLPVQRLHALDIATGREKLSGPVTISASVPGTATGNIGGLVAFDPLYENQRAGLLEVNGNVYVAFGSHCDLGNFHGWILGYNATTLAQTAVFITTPKGEDSGIWMSGAGLAADKLNGGFRVFPVTGNGTYDAFPPHGTNNMDYGDAIVRLTVGSNGGLKVADSFAPQNQSDRDVLDRDLGSGGALLAPDQPGLNPHLLVAMGKDVAGQGNFLYLVNRDNLGGLDMPTGPVVQRQPIAGSLYGMPAYWNGNLYVWPGSGQLNRFGFINGKLTGPGETSLQHSLGGAGSTPSISANSTQNGIAWSVDSSHNPQVVYAHKATDVSQLLWSSTQNAAFDSAGLPQRFVVPTIADGRVFIGAVNQVQVYALIPPLSFGLSESRIFFGRYGWTFPIKLTDLPDATVWVTNSEAGPLTKIQFDIGGANPDNFFAYGGNCPDALGPGQRCYFTVVFNPQKKGNFNATLEVTGFSGNGSVKVAEVALSGTGLGPK